MCMIVYITSVAGCHIFSPCGVSLQLNTIEYLPVCGRGITTVEMGIEVYYSSVSSNMEVRNPSLISTSSMRKWYCLFKVTSQTFRALYASSSGKWNRIANAEFEFKNLRISYVANVTRLLEYATLLYSDTVGSLVKLV